MKLLMVSGGGSAINYASLAAGGGGGGGVYYNSAYEIKSNSYNIVVGAGSGVNSGAPGGSTVFGAEIVYGGALGETAAHAYGGGGGGQRNNVGGNFSGGAYGYASGYSTAGHAAGGGGAGGQGGNASDITGGGAGGAGIACDITGTSLIYGEGGGGGYGGTTTGVGGRGATSPGVVGSGMNGRGGGGGGTYNGYGSGAGGSGTVIVSYITSEWGACTGGTITTNGIWTVHTFTANGTFTVVHAIKKIAGVAPQSGISLDATTVKSNGTASANNCTWSHTISPGTDRVLVVYIPMSQAVYPSSITYGGTAITANLAAAYDASAKAYIFVMTNPPVGTADIVVTFNGTLQYLIASAASFFGVNQTTPFTNSTITTGGAQNKSFNLYAPYGGCWILECIGMGSTTNTAASGQTALTGANRISSYDDGTVISNNTQSWTADGSAGYAYVGVCLVPNRTHFNKIFGILGTSIKKVMGIGNR